MEGPEAGPRLEAEGGDFPPFPGSAAQGYEASHFPFLRPGKEKGRLDLELSLTDLILSAYTEVCLVLGNTRRSSKDISRKLI